MMGVGIVEPLDGFDLARYYPSGDLPDGWTVQPSHPYLLDELARDFQASGFRFKHLVRTIARSSTYQLSSQCDYPWKPEYGRYFARRNVRMLSPIQLHDAIVTATAVPGAYPSGGTDVGMARQVLDPAYVKGEVGEFLRAFGQQSRDQFPVRPASSSLQAMLMMNSRTVLDRVQSDGVGRVAKMLDWQDGEMPEALAEYPAYNVDWHDARAFCEWKGKRLPSEAEWERAARGKLEGVRYPWGDQKPDRDRTRFSTPEGPAPVAQYHPNDFGLYDMAGGVAEWCQDWFNRTYYSNSPAENPKGPSEGMYRIVRGGAWSDGPNRITVFFRNWIRPNQRTPNLGFRCVQEVR